jgi:hypothetical protein
MFNMGKRGLAGEELVKILIWIVVFILLGGAIYFLINFLGK